MVELRTFSIGTSPFLTQYLRGTTWSTAACDAALLLTCYCGGRRHSGRPCRGRASWGQRQEEEAGGSGPCRLNRLKILSRVFLSDDWQASSWIRCCPFPLGWGITALSPLAVHHALPQSVKCKRFCYRHPQSFSEAAAVLDRRLPRMDKLGIAAWIDPRVRANVS